MSGKKKTPARKKTASAVKRVDAIELEVFKHLYASAAEEMGAALVRSAFSPNITERRDCSCAVFDDRGVMIAQAAHVPVHLGSTPLSVEAAIRELPMEAGDVVILNDPFRGGTHYQTRRPHRAAP